LESCRRITGVHVVSAKGFFVMSSGVETSLTARERSEDPEANSKRFLYSGRNDRKFPSGRRVHEPCS
jgi:hypothetical protein